MENATHPLYVPRDGSNLIVADHALERFLLQQKDNTHPVERCRGLWALFGGMTEDQESPRETLEREIREEMALPELHELLLGNLREYCRKTLACWPLAGTFVGTFFICELSRAEIDRVAELIALPGTILEGSAHIRSRAEVTRLVETPQTFIASHDQILRRLLGQ